MANLLNELKSSVAGVSAIVSAVAALSCCLPFGFLAALGLSGTSIFLHLFQPWLLGLSVVFLGIGFLQHYRGTRCNAKRNRLIELVLWTGTLPKPSFFDGPVNDVVSQLKDLLEQPALSGSL